MLENKNQKGFTLVEMILVTVIIGILASIVIGVINIPRLQARSRDSKRIGDLKMIQSSLELYFANNRRYPQQVGSWVLTNSTGFSNYISNIPSDPRKDAPSGVSCFTNGITNYGYYYRSQSDGKYILGGVMEIMDTAAEGNSCTAASVSNCGDSSYGCKPDIHCYCVQNPM